jgi:hypothetical protein
MDDVRDLDYWTTGDRRPKPLVGLGRASCRRCPHPIDQVPRDKVTLVPEAGGYRRSFVCPHCRALATQLIGREEALRLYADGVPIARLSHDRDALTHDEVSRLADELRRDDDLVLRALDDAAA